MQKQNKYHNICVCVSHAFQERYWLTAFLSHNKSYMLTNLWMNCPRSVELVENELQGSQAAQTQRASCRIYYIYTDYCYWACLFQFVLLHGFFVLFKSASPVWCISYLGGSQRVVSEKPKAFGHRAQDVVCFASTFFLRKASQLCVAFNFAFLDYPKLLQRCQHGKFCQRWGQEYKTATRGLLPSSAMAVKIVVFCDGSCTICDLPKIVPCCHCWEHRTDSCSQSMLLFVYIDFASCWWILSRAETQGAYFQLSNNFLSQSAVRLSRRPEVMLKTHNNVSIH